MHPEASDDLLSYAGKLEAEGSNAATLCGAKAACVGCRTVNNTTFGSHVYMHGEPLVCR